MRSTLWWRIKNFTYCLANKIAGGNWEIDYSGVRVCGPKRFDEFREDETLGHDVWSGPLPKLVRDDIGWGNQWRLIPGWPFTVWVEEVKPPKGEYPLRTMRVTVYIFNRAVYDRYMSLL